MLNNVRLSKKIIMICAIALIPLIAFSSLFIARLYREAVDRAVTQAQARAQQHASNVLGKLSLASALSENQLLGLGSLRSYVATIYDDEYQSYIDYVNNIAPIITALTSYDGLSLKIYSDNDTLRFSGVTNNSMDDLVRMPWYLGESTGGKLIWTADYDRYNKNHYYGYYRTVTLPARGGRQNQKIRMTLAVFVPETNLSRLFFNETREGHQVYLYDEAGRVITSTGREAISKNLRDLDLDAGILNIPPGGGQVVMHGGVRQVAVVASVLDESLGMGPLNILYMVPVDEAVAEIRTVLINNIMLCVAVLMVTFALTYLVAGNMARRINRLSAGVGKVWEADFQVSVPVSGRDEIGALEQNLNAIFQKTNDLIHTVYRAQLDFKNAEIEKKEAQIVALQGQINPHYLFNTIEAIKMGLVLRQDIEKIVPVLDAFGESFRVFIDANIDMIPIEEEIRFLNNYITIQEYIHEGDIKFFITLGRDLSQARIPKLIIQPLVENAIHHGVMPRGHGRVSIDIMSGEDLLLIEVMDDGIGMDENELQQIDRAICGPGVAPGTGGVALGNIYRRLRLIYGDQFGMNIESGVGGTLICLHMPLDLPDGSGGEA